MRTSPWTQVDVPGEKERGVASQYTYDLFSHRAFSSFLLPLRCTRADYIRGHVIREGSFSTNFDELCDIPVLIIPAIYILGVHIHQLIAPTCRLTGI